MITDLISIEASYININHPDFIGGENAITRIIQRKKARDLQNSVCLFLLKC